jgi:hypothetical protein
MCGLLKTPQMWSATTPHTAYLYIVYPFVVGVGVVIVIVFTCGLLKTTQMWHTAYKCMYAHV